MPNEDPTQTPPAPAPVVDPPAAKPALSLEEALSELSKVKSEAATRRQNEKALQEKVTLERAEKEQLKAQIVQDRKAAALKEALTAAGAIGPKVAKLIDLDAIQVTDAGEVKGALEAVAAFKTASPEFFKAEPATPAAPPVVKTGSDRVPPTPGLPGKPGTVADLNPTDYEAAKLKAIYG